MRLVDKTQRMVIQSISNINSSYWFIPTVMCLGGIALSLLMIQLDQYLGAESIKNIPLIVTKQPEGARLLLSTIAGSMITVAGVTFSMTLLSVSHASSQIGPRILSNFMKDKGNQITLGTFITTFTYCLLVLRTIKAETNSSGSALEPFIPHLSVFTGLILAFASIAVLIYFINHVPKTINMTKAVNQVGNRFEESIANIFPEQIGDASQTVSKKTIPVDFEKNSVTIHSNGKGYIQHLNNARLMKIAVEHGVIIMLLKRPGEFVCNETMIAKAYPAENCTDELSVAVQNVFIWGDQKTTDQNIEFASNLLVEVAVRALSPGINDPYSANDCFDQLSSGLIRFSKSCTPDRIRFDDDNNVRVIAQNITFEELYSEIFNKLRLYVSADPISSLHLMSVFNFMSEQIFNIENLKVVKEQSDLLLASCQKNLQDKTIIKQLSSINQKLQIKG